MKNFLKISLLAAIILTASIAQANEDNFSLSVSTGKDKSIRFFINEAKDINLSLYGANDEVLLEQKIHTVGASTKIYNLDAFPDGNYVLKIESDSKLSQYQINITNGKTSISTPYVTDLFKPVLRRDNQVVTLNIASADKSPIEIQILNEFNEELYTEVFTDKAQLTKKFDVGQTNASTLTFIVRVKDQTFVKDVDVLQ